MSALYVSGAEPADSRPHRFASAFAAMTIRHVPAGTSFGRFGLVAPPPMPAPYVLAAARCALCVV